MSLYDGLGLDSNQGEKATGWSSSFTMLKSQLEAKKAALTKAKHEKFRSGNPVVAPVINLNKAVKTEEQLDYSHDDKLVDTKPSPFLGGESLDQFEDEYDPRYPNEYEKVTRKRRERRQREREEERQREMEDRRKRRDSRHSDRDNRRDDRAPHGRFGGPGSGFSRRPASDEDEEDDDYEREKRIRMTQGSKAAIAPPTILIEEDKKAEIAPPPPPLALAGGAGTQFARNMAGSVAHKIMTKYGFKEGLGLGKGNRGISHALQVEKTSKRGGKIIPSSQIEKQLEEEKKREQEEKESVANLLKNPTKVVCLRNMVGPGEVDQELEGETSEECSKYGEVRKCMIYEMVGQQEEEAVRIFIEFERLESAIKAVVDLNGRYFGGRTVRACFYDVSKFRDLHLGDPL
ncbi:splicing factor 45-like [Styela clava]|uniref:splicing factor 45-like n=1 Tax=Styela clava TaxID=7725 RepID=UPI00193AB94E|nr:splicing factor 45-like [Styela clava]